MKKYLTLFALALLLLSTKQARAAENDPQFLVTWKTDTYTPAQYAGKALPTSKSRITISFDLIDNGTLVDLSKQPVRWFYGRNLVDAKQGLQTISIKLPEFIDGDKNFRIEIPSLKDTVLTYSVNIPIVQPEAVIEWPSLTNTLTTQSVEMRGLPYFFNVSDPGFLNFAWQVNGKTPLGTQSPDTLNLSLDTNTPTNTPIEIGLKIKNPQGVLEKDESFLELTYYPKIAQ
jgi:hypothetical protein